MQLTSMISGFGIGEEINNKSLSGNTYTGLKKLIDNSWAENQSITLLFILFIFCYSLFVNSIIELLIFGFSGVILSYFRNISMVHQLLGNKIKTILIGNGLISFFYVFIVLLFYIFRQINIAVFLGFIFLLILFIFHYNFQGLKSFKSNNLGSIRYDYLIINIFGWLIGLGFSYILNLLFPENTVIDYGVITQISGMFLFLPTSYFQSINKLNRSGIDDKELKTFFNKGFLIVGLIIASTSIAGSFILFDLKNIIFLEKFHNLPLFISLAGLCTVVTLGYHNSLYFVYSEKKSSVLKKVVIFTDSISILLSIILGLKYGINGIMIGFTIGGFLKSILLMKKIGISISLNWIFTCLITLVNFMYWAFYKS